MTGRKRDVRRAKLEAQEARARIVTTLALLQHRLNPRVLVREVWEDVRDQGREAADNVVGAVKARPATAALAAGAIAMLLAREPVWRALLHLFAIFSNEEETTVDDNGSAVTDSDAGAAGQPGEAL